MRFFPAACAAVLLAGIVGSGTASASAARTELPLAASVTEVVFVLAHPVELNVLVASLGKLNVSPISFSHITKEGYSGGHASRGQSLSDAVERYRENYHDLVGTGEPRITRFSVLGPASQVNSATLGMVVTSAAGPIGGLSRSAAVPTAPPLSDQEKDKAPALLPAPVVMPHASRSEGNGGDGEASARSFRPVALNIGHGSFQSTGDVGGSLPAQGPPPPPSESDKSPASTKWGPQTGRVETKDGPTVPATEDDDARERRLMTHELTWADQASIDDFGPRTAYEHDFKLINRGNNGPSRDGVGTSPLCAPWQSNNFWASGENVTFTTNIPDEVKTYLDTSALDPCQERDFTVGLYHPNKLKPATLYRIDVLADKGDFDKSPYRLQGQRLQKTTEGCEFEWCVGVTPGGANQQLVGDTKGAAPECRRWGKGELSRLC